MSIITEEMHYRQKLCEFAKKYGVTKAARRYHTNRQFVYRQLKKYDGTVRSLALGSRRPLHSPNAHTKSELKLIRKMLKRNGINGLAEVYVRCKGREFVNDDDKTSKESAFEKAAYNLGITIKRTRPYSPWQNGKVERSHREDGKILYNRKVFTSEKDLINQVAKHERRYNSTAKTSLKFKSPNEVVEEYFKNTACYCEN